MGINFGNSLSVLTALKLTPLRMKADLRKKFKIVISGSKDWAESFVEVLTKGAVYNAADNEEETLLNEMIQVLPSPLSEESIRTLKSNLLIYLLNKEDINESHLNEYRVLSKMNPPALILMEEPEDMVQRELILQKMDSFFVGGQILWIESPAEDIIKQNAEHILKSAGHLDISIAYRFPILRDAMAKKMIAGTATQNMVIALASSLPANLPVVGIIIGLLAVAGETTVLTVNQTKLCLQLAGLYGHDLNLYEKIKELWPLFGTAYGFKTIARSLVGFLPIAGPTIKAAIAYAGTAAVGEAARWYYETGRHLSQEEKNRVYEEALKKAIEKAQKYIEEIKKTASKPHQKPSEEADAIQESMDRLKREIFDADSSAVDLNEEEGELLEESKENHSQGSAYESLEESDSQKTPSKIITSDEAQKNENVELSKPSITETLIKEEAAKAIKKKESAIVDTLKEQTNQAGEESGKDKESNLDLPADASTRIIDEAVDKSGTEAESSRTIKASEEVKPVKPKSKTPKTDKKKSALKNNKDGNKKSTSLKKNKQEDNAEKE